MGVLVAITRRWVALFSVRGRQSLNLQWYESVYKIVLILTLIGATLVPIGFSEPRSDGGALASNDLDAPRAYFFFLGLLVLVGTAAFSMGGFLGFIFGVPRISSPSGIVQSNTNLEQVSDWLTKIVVGVSLVNLYKVDSALSRFRDAVDRTVPNILGAGVTACIVLLSCVAAGFLVTYLRAKTDLMEAFSQTYVALADAARSNLKKVAMQVLSRPSIKVDDKDLATATTLIKACDPNDADPSNQRLIGYAQAVLKNFAGASEAFEAASKADPTSSVSLPLRANSLVLSNKLDEASQLLSKSATTASSARDQLELKLSEIFAGLYDTPNGYKASIDMGESLASTPEGQRSGRLWLYLAAAYGQRQLALQNQMNLAPSEALQASLKENRIKALEAVNQAIATDRKNNLPVLRQLWTPGLDGKDPDENDLEVFSDDEAFKSLLKV